VASRSSGARRRLYPVPLSRRAITACILHALCQLLLREPRTAARLDHRRRQRELLFKGIISPLVFGILVPGSEGCLDRIIFLLMSLPPRRSGAQPLDGPEHGYAEPLGGVAQIGILRCERNGEPHCQSR
jgi:hypothetical protein